MKRLSGILEHRSLKRWERAALAAEDMALPELKALRNRARMLRARVDQVVRTADAGLARQAPIPRPLHTEWAWRPELWSRPVEPAGVVSAANGVGFGREAKLFHDCGRAELSVRQSRSTLAPYALAIEVFHFGGSFLSLAVDLPEAGVTGLSRRHLVRLNVQADAERPTAIYGRLNIKQGPDIVQVVRLIETGEAGVADLDLASVELDEGRISSAWIDLIFDAPGMNRIRLDDVTISRRPRAEI